MKVIYLTLVCVFIGQFSFAQDDVNLVPNGDFESANTKSLKNFGQLQDVVENWYSATKAPVDVFSRGIKSDRVSIPQNAMGIQEAASGDLYAGFRAYTKDKKLDRTYLGVDLSERLEKDQMYCLEFKISLSDLSKFGTNFIGAVFSDRKSIQPNTGPIVRDLNSIHVKHRSNKAMILQDGWETVCGTFIAKGKEAYMIIGGFGSDRDLELVKMPRSKEVSGAQVYDAYYYIDDVRLYPVSAKSQCACDPASDRQPDLIYGQTVVMSENMSDNDKVNVSAVYYAFLKKNITSAGESTLEQIIEVMNNNPSWKLEVIGHCDNDEFNEAKINPRHANLGQQRAEQVVRYLAGKGVDSSRLIPLSKENTDPANERPTDLSRAQNRRVVFLIRK
jgi:outer membrane protein OmpA-like peptidoglycan-associated protein